MISTELSEKVLTIGCSCKNPKGGIAAVIHSYSQIFSPFYFVRTTGRRGIVARCITVVNAVSRYLYYVVFKKIKIVHIHTASYKSFYRKSLFVLISRLLHVKVVLHVHGGKFEDFYSKKTAFVSWILNKCDCVIALSTFWENFFKKTSRSKVTIIKNIIPIPTITPVSKNDCLTILFLGAINQQKGIFDLLECLSRYKKEFNGKLKLIIGGTGENERLQKIIENNGLQSMVDFRGWLSGDDKVECMNKADVFVLPSYAEGVPISILEAMSYGMPIISCPVGGIPEIVNSENGFFVESGDIDAIAEKIKYFIENREAVRLMGGNSQQIIEQHYPNAVAASLTDLYKSLIN